ncbi:MAG: rubrerythrin family protein [Candidatus Bathyarchaeota archaeon]|nr:MAG: rubrerythrin family protein [Candidatus Bathyarchaeota archaeon]
MKGGEFKVSKTADNLKSAFAGESQANRRYIAFAQKAEDEGFSQVARLFRAAAEAETVHALNHLKTLKEVKSTKANLETAISGEHFEFKEMYPGYLDAAKKDGNPKAAWSFNVANQVEAIHASLFSKALAALKQGVEMAETDYYVCRVCGNTVEGMRPEKCPICGAAKTEFFKTD